MNSLTDLREVVDVVIGVDTHVWTHSAAAVNAATGGVLGEITVEATAQGYAQLVEFADEHAVLRAWRSRGPVATAPSNWTLGASRSSVTGPPFGASTPSCGWR